MNFDVVFQSLPFLLRGAVVTIEIAAVSVGLALCLGLVLGLARAYGGRITNAIIGFPVDILRSIPLLALMVWAFYALPVMIDKAVSPFVAGALSLGVQYAAFVSEVFRGGLRSVGVGQSSAAHALGMTHVQTIRRIVLPQAAIRMLPPLGSLAASLIKDTSLLYGIGVAELMRNAATLNGLESRPFEIFTVVGFIYAAITAPVMVIVNFTYRRLASRAAG